MHKIRVEEGQALMQETEEQKDEEEEEVAAPVSVY